MAGCSSLAIECIAPSSARPTTRPPCFRNASSSCNVQSVKSKMGLVDIDCPKLVRFLPSPCLQPIMSGYTSEGAYKGPEAIVVAMDIGTTHSEHPTNGRDPGRD
jgi:hypothetical protein